MSKVETPVKVRMSDSTHLDEEDLEDSIINFEKESELFDNLNSLFQSLSAIHSDEETKSTSSSDNFTDDYEDDGFQSEWLELTRVEEILRQELNQESMMSSRAKNFTKDENYTLLDHFKSLKLSKHPSLGYVCDISQFYSLDSTNNVFEFCQPISEEKLDSVYFGLKSGSSKELTASPPFRTMLIPIRPDKLRGAIMDAVANAIVASSKDNNLNLLKRQGSHLRAVIVTELASFVVDAQLCLKRKGNFQRHLLIRMYYPTPREMAECSGVDCHNSSSAHKEKLNERTIPANDHLKEACSFIQMITEMGLSEAKNLEDKQFPRQSTLNPSKTDASSNLRSKFVRSRSVINRSRRFLFQRKALLLPALSDDDWLALQSSWSFCESLWSGLGETFAFNSLRSTPLERENEIPFLDLHYCMSLFDLQQAPTTAELKRTQEVLKAHENRGKYFADVFSKLTRPMLDLYGFERPGKVEEDVQSDWIPGSSYGEDVDIPVVVSVANRALESSKILEGDNSSEEVLKKAIHLVNMGYQAHHRKVQKETIKAMNDMVQKRLFKYRHGLLENYKCLQNAHLHSKQAVEESKIFLKQMQQANPIGSEDKAFRHVPFLKNGAEGGNLLYITETHILLSINKIFQQSRVQIFKLSDIESSAMPNGYLMIRSSDEEEFLFYPSIDVDSLNLFINIMQSLQKE